MGLLDKLFGIKSKMWEFIDESENDAIHSDCPMDGFIEKSQLEENKIDQRRTLTPTENDINMKKKLMSLLITSRKVSPKELKDLSRELYLHMYYDIPEVGKAVENGEISENDINNYYTQWDMEMIERYSKIIGIVDWGEITSSEGLMAARTCFEDNVKNCDMKGNLRFYGCHFFCWGGNGISLVYSNCLITHMAFLGLVVIVS